MSSKGFKRMLLGEKEPDKNDPKYKERYERDAAAGRKFARWTRMDKLAECIQRFADNNRNLFLVLVFAFVAVSVGFNIYRLSCVYRHQAAQRSVIEVQDSVLKATRQGVTIQNNTYYDNSRD